MIFTLFSVYKLGFSSARLHRKFLTSETPPFYQQKLLAKIPVRTMSNRFCDFPCVYFFEVTLYFRQIDCHLIAVRLSYPKPKDGGLPRTIKQNLFRTFLKYKLQSHLSAEFSA